MKKGETKSHPFFNYYSFILYRLLVQKIPFKYVFMSFFSNSLVHSGVSKPLKSGLPVNPSRKPKTCSNSYGFICFSTIHICMQLFSIFIGIGFLRIYFYNFTSSISNKILFSGVAVLNFYQLQVMALLNCVYQN
jgi:hypothetical protein